MEVVRFKFIGFWLNATHVVDGLTNTWLRSISDVVTPMVVISILRLGVSLVTTTVICRVKHSVYGHRHYGMRNAPDQNLPNYCCLCVFLLDYIVFPLSHSLCSFLYIFLSTLVIGVWESEINN